MSLKSNGGQGRNRTADASLFRAALYRLSYLATSQAFYVRALGSVNFLYSFSRLVTLLNLSQSLPLNGELLWSSSSPGGLILNLENCHSSTGREHSLSNRCVSRLKCGARASRPFFLVTSRNSTQAVLGLFVLRFSNPAA